MVIPNTYIDETKGRVLNPFGSKLVVHANRWPAFPDELREILCECAGEPEDIFHNIHKNGTYVVIPGDCFGTEGEHHKRKAYADIVGMTIFPEALASLFGMEYACAAIVVDLDKDTNHEHGTRQVMEKLSQEQHVPQYIERLIPQLKAYVKRIESSSEFVRQKLEGNIIPYCPDKIRNEYLRHIAQEIVATYCVK